MTIIDGKKIASQILKTVKSSVNELKYTPIFCDILVGEDPASKQYVKMKAKTAIQVGFKFRTAEYSSKISTDELVSEVIKISSEENIRGLIVQLPLPKTIDKLSVLDSIDPKIDVDCIGQENSNKFYNGQKTFIFPTAAAIMEILNRNVQNLKTKNIAMVGYGELVGRPVTFLLEQLGCQVKVIRSTTQNPEEILKQADIIVSAVGKPKLISREKIKSGCVIIDAGTSESNGGIVGDIDTESLKNFDCLLSPVPGGVGPITVAKLMSNVYQASTETN